MTPDSGPYKVLLKRGEFTDEAREKRPVAFKLYHPAELKNEKVPIIFWSHGFGGNRDGAAFLSRHIASHGYVIIHLTHLGTDSSLWEGKDGHPWDILRKAEIPRETTINRFKDVPFALDQLKNWAKDNPEIGETMDFENIGMSGHSFGAMTTQVMAGMLFPNSDNELQSLAEPRFKAGILYSPVPISHLVGPGNEEKIYSPINIPLLHMTGTDDASPLEDFGYEYRLVVKEHAGHPEQYLQVLQDGDHMVYNGTRGKLADNPLRETHENEIMSAALAFWDAKLKNDSEAQSFLSQYHTGSQV